MQFCHAEFQIRYGTDVRHPILLQLYPSIRNILFLLFSQTPFQPPQPLVLLQLKSRLVTQPSKEFIYYFVYRTFLFSINSVNFPPLEFFPSKLVFPHDALLSLHTRIPNARCDHPVYLCSVLMLCCLALFYFLSRWVSHCIWITLCKILTKCALKLNSVA